MGDLRRWLGKHIMSVGALVYGVSYDARWRIAKLLIADAPWPNMVEMGELRLNENDAWHHFRRWACHTNPPPYDGRLTPSGRRVK